MPSFSGRSRANLQTCEDDLITLFNAVIEKYDCTVLQGHRSMEEQKQLFRDGKTKTLASKHLHSPSKAVDVMPYPIDWEDIQGQHEFAAVVLATAVELGIKVKWGGHFKTFYDAPHWEIIE